ncbi:GNAT superfamily N-acetyltransferase [Kitasatospora sp. GP30]|uniref:GNAT family N-acetyltransferase n=1 Tax=Kitasatospora sp. GP30 TaxID=3035084 RepID=UPI000CAD5661|nr:GNAT family N-acetyltransferase [Kitasatospora sp. GP30]MDH6144865.1 GNAT superfamily N-acetyltransferase [Kitasatospora sp. GP30]
MTGAAPGRHRRRPAGLDGPPPGRRPVTAGDLPVWTARRQDGALAGTVGLALTRKANGTHRAEIVKLMVHPGSRRQGLAARLPATAEQTARRHGVSLLLLDTEAGSDAEALYQGAGWTRFGVVPGYATDPLGRLRDGSFSYKLLA